MRNKQRQRDQLFASGGGGNGAMTSSLNNSWQREQEKINAILDPKATKYESYFFYYLIICFACEEEFHANSRVKYVEQNLDLMIKRFYKT